MMNLIATLLVALVAVAHAGFLVLEMFLWTTPFASRLFKMTPEYAAATSVMAANQGLYNGFLAAGLAWGMVAHGDGFAIKVFFLTCVIVAGLFGAVTTKKMPILLIQALPAALALGCVVVAHRGA